MTVRDNSSVEALSALLEARTAQLDTINRISQILSQASTLRAIFKGVRQETLAMVRATGMSISLLNDTGDHLDWIYGYEYGEEVDLSNIPPSPLSKGLSGYVARTREILHIDDKSDALAQQLQSQIVGASPQAWLGLPLIVSNKLVGVLAVENAEDATAFGRRDIELLTTISGPVAVAINNQRQYDQIETALARQSQHHLQLQTAAEVSGAAGSILELGELLQTAVHLIQQRFALYYVGLFLVEGSGQEAVLRAGTGEAGRRQVEAGFRLTVGGRSLIGGACDDGKPRIVQDVAADKEWKPNPQLPYTCSELALPLRVRGRTIGALTVQSGEPHHFTPELVRTLQTMSDQIATAIENARLLTQTQESARRQRILNEISARLHRTTDVETILELGLSALSEQLGGARIDLKLGRAAFADGQGPGPAAD